MHQNSTITAPATASACATKLKCIAFSPIAILFFPFSSVSCFGGRKREGEGEDEIDIFVFGFIFNYLCVSNPFYAIDLGKSILLSSIHCPSGPLILEIHLNWDASRGPDGVGRFSYPRVTFCSAYLLLPLNLNLRFL